MNPQKIEAKVHLPRFWPGSSLSLCREANWILLLWRRASYHPLYSPLEISHYQWVDSFLVTFYLTSPLA
jgi:hypothetical protein